VDSQVLAAIVNSRSKPRTRPICSIFDSNLATARRGWTVFP